MAGITAMGTTYNLPNYTGILYALTPADTPFFSSIGGLNGGMQTASTEFEWEFYDLRAAAQNVQLEGATAPTAQERVRSNITNVTQIHQEKISVSYSKQAAVGQKSGTNNALPNPIANELDWQTEQMLKQMVRDVEWSFINGSYQKPTDNTTKRQTKGMLSIIATNVANAGTLIGATLAATASTDLITKTAHGLANGDQVVISVINTPDGLVAGATYYIVGSTANTFQLSLTSGGAAVDITADSTVTVTKAASVTIDTVDALLQQIYDNGGITEQATATLVVNSAQKRKVTKAYMTAFAQRFETSRTMGGVSVDTILTDFGTLNVMLDRFMPQNQMMVCSMEQIQPVFLEIPSKGHFFAEPLAKTGASDEVQLYGETGLAFGNEKAHGVLTNLAV